MDACIHPEIKYKKTHSWQKVYSDCVFWELIWPCTCMQASMRAADPNVNNSDCPPSNPASSKWNSNTYQLVLTRLRPGG
eukprot:2104041-Rhodomonas_salina.1